MKAAKRKRASQPSASAPNRRWMLPAILGGVLLICVVWFFWPDNPRTLYERALESFPADPADADQLLIRSIAAAGGNFPEAQLLRCRVLGARGQWVEALGQFTLIADTSQCDPEQLGLLALEAAAARQAVLAEQAGEAALRQQPQREEWLRLLTGVKYQLDRSDEVLDLARRWSEVAPRDPQPWVVSAQTHKNLSQLPEAIADCRQALARATDEQRGLELRTSLFDMLVDTGDLPAARQEMTGLLAAHGDDRQLRIKNAHLLRLEGDGDAALREIEKALATEPNSTAALMLRGVLLLDAAQYEQAAKDLKRVVQADPYNKEAHYKLGQAYQRLNQPEKAQPHLEKSDLLTRQHLEILDLLTAAKRDPENVDIRKKLADLYDRVGQPELATHWRPR